MLIFSTTLEGLHGRPARPMMRKIRYRWESDLAAAPRVGGYIMSAHRPRGGYLIHHIRNAGRRGGLGVAFHHLLVLTVERVSVAEASAGPLWAIRWDGRRRRQS